MIQFEEAALNELEALARAYRMNGVSIPESVNRTIQEAIQRLEALREGKLVECHQREPLEQIMTVTEDELERNFVLADDGTLDSVGEMYFDKDSFDE